MTEHALNITIRGARLHNLRNVDVHLPRHQLVAITGVSGSGKSSLAFGTIHGEAQRRYFESVAPFARRLIGSATNPQVESVDGLPPSVALEQNTSAGGARSTVGTVSAMSNTVRLLYSRTGTYPEGLGHLDSDHFSPNTTAGMCPTCQGTGTTYEPTERSMVPDDTLSINDGAIKAWPRAWAGKNFRDILDTLGIPMDTPWRELDAETREWILFTDERPVVTVHPIRRANQVEKEYQGTWRSTANYLRETLATTESDTLRKRTISFMEAATCGTCDGRRLTPDALGVTYLGLPIDELNDLSLTDLGRRLAEHTPASEAERLLLDALTPTLDSAIELGLGHLSLGRPARTLSAGELQRVRLASQLRAGLFGVLYVLDEPSAGLHPVERTAITRLVRRFIDQGNSVILVEHDMNLVAETDWLIDVGPFAGEGGGEIQYSGPTADYLEKDLDTPTARALAARSLDLNDAPRDPHGQLEFRDITSRSLNGVDLSIGLGQLTGIVGVSGSGKSTLLKVVADALKERATRLDESGEPSGDEADRAVTVASISGLDHVDRLVEITQKPIGRTPRSSVATYTGLFDRVRKLYAATDAARSRGWTVSRFSYNVKQGQCPTCSGEGKIEVELVFLPGSYVTCPDCDGARYDDDTLSVTYRGLTIADVLQLTVTDAVDVFADQPAIARSLRALDAVGLGYLRLGQGAPELSGGEAQRIKLATELQRAPRGHTLYLLDEPTTGLHPADAQLLVRELHGLVEAGNTVVMVEHDLAAVAGADRLLELGPGAGAEGGRIVADDTPAGLAGADTATGRVLAQRRK